MDYRYLGRSGLKISEITYGNWLTHGSQVENDAATACVRARSTPASPPSTPPTSTRTPRPRRCSARRSQGERRESLEIFTKVYWPTGPKGHNDAGLSRKHIMESIDGSLRRLQTDYVDLYQAHRYDTETPLEETMQAFADLVRAGKALYIGVSGVDRRADPRRARAGPGARHPARLEPAAVLDALAGHRGRGRARLPGARHLADRLVADRAGRADRQVQARAARPRPGSRATDDKGGANMIKRWLRDDVLDAGRSSWSRSPTSSGCRWRSSRSPGCCRTTTSPAAIIGASRPEQVAENVEGRRRADPGRS